MSWFGLGKTETKVYRERDLKAHVKSGLIRLNLRKNKAQTAVQKARKDISVLLKNGDDEKARIIAEQGMKEENLVSAFEELQALCEEVQSRIGIITANKRLPIDLKEPICTLIWASARIDIKEFGLIREQFALRFGANLDHEALCNIENCVSDIVINLLSPEPPEETTVFAYLKNVAVEFNIEWGFDEDLEVPEASLQDIYGFAMGDVTEPAVDDVISHDASQISIDDFPDVHSPLASFGSTESPKQTVDDVDDLDAFEKMFAPIPTSNNVSSTPVKSVGLVSQPKIQKVSVTSPQLTSGTVQTVKHVQPVSQSATKNMQTPKATAVKNLNMSQELAHMSEKDLEAEFEQLFNCSLDEAAEDTLPEQGKPSSSISLEKSTNTPTPDLEANEKAVVTSTIQLEKSPGLSPVQTKLNEAEFTVQHVSTAESTEYDDLFSASVPQTESEGPPVDILPSAWSSETAPAPMVQENDYDDIFERLSSISSQTSVEQNNNSGPAEPSIEGMNEMTDEEWAARFNSSASQMLDPSSFDFGDSTDISIPAAPEEQKIADTSDDDLMRRFMAL
uniref:IST1-like protein n=1 Tax=Vannella robusta TaxID=1487602 RepID=A0A7S4HH59_9EUKA|mmetsp:Transcript_10067/g.12389  ORF Transcript_10067/g.12389 Transcript_10067/m.12389 type:complete len:563 (+) Transcript_10067:44-1732(+)